MRLCTLSLISARYAVLILSRTSQAPAFISRCVLETVPKQRDVFGVSNVFLTWESSITSHFDWRYFRTVCFVATRLILVRCRTSVQFDDVAALTDRRRFLPSVPPRDKADSVINFIVICRTKRGPAFTWTTPVIHREYS